LSAVLSYLYSYKIPDVYGASTRILLKDNRVYDYQTQVFSNIGYVSAFGDIGNQRRVLTSYDLIDRTLSKLDFDVSYYIIGRFKTSEVYGNMPFSVRMEVLNPKLYEKPFDLRVVNPTTFELSYDRGTGLVTKPFPFNTDIADPDFVLRIDRSPEVAPGNITKYTESDYRFVRHSRSWLVDRYTTGMTVGNPDGTSILEVTVEDEIPTRAKMFLDTLSKEYIDYTLRSEFEINENTVNYIDRQMEEVSVILNKNEDDLQNFLLTRNILDLNKENDRYYNELVGYDHQKREYEMMVESVDALEDYVRNIGQGKLLPPSFYILNDDVFLRSSLTNLYEMQMQRNDMLYPATEGNPAMGKLDNSIQLNKANLLIYLKNTREAIKQKVQDVEKQIHDYEGLIRTVPQNQRDVQNIQRKVDVNEKLYEFLLEKRANTVIAKAGIVPQTKVIEMARVLGVVRPDKVKILYTFIVGGAILSMLLVFIRVVFYDRIENADQLREATNVPVFGEIIASEKAEENYVVVDSDPKSAITESFRSIRTNLEYLPQTEGGKVVMVTSYRPNEGKTFCSVNLSAILAKAGKKVLLLELDLHKPKVGFGLGMNSTVGLSNILVGKAGFAECVQPTQIENYHVI
ncbi:MAG TPA: GNVR domain-containing protein, partial [Flavobacteriales bacterium]|nr:GNVR domain-containing protein [Flavobacteriales bacterium]